MLKRKIKNTLIRWQKRHIYLGSLQWLEDAGIICRCYEYMQFLLDLEPEQIKLEPIDTDQLTRLAKEALAGHNF